MANEPKQDIKRYLEYSEYPATTFDLVTAGQHGYALTDDPLEGRVAWRVSTFT
jgi:hypothetical protein